VNIVLIWPKELSAFATRMMVEWNEVELDALNARIASWYFLNA